MSQISSHKVGIALTLLILPLLAFLFVNLFLNGHFNGFQVGGGASEQSAPQSILTGHAANLKLELTVWGSNARIQGRYTHLKLYYKLTSETAYKVILNAVPVPPNKSQLPNTSESYLFTIPAYPKGTIGEIEYYYEVRLDGVQSQIPGLTHITILPEN